MTPTSMDKVMAILGEGEMLEPLRQVVNLCGDVNQHDTMGRL